MEENTARDENVKSNIDLTPSHKAQLLLFDATFHQNYDSPHLYTACLNAEKGFLRDVQRIHRIAPISHFINNIAWLKRLRLQTFKPYDWSKERSIVEEDWGYNLAFRIYKKDLNLDALVSMCLGRIHREFKCDWKLSVTSEEITYTTAIRLDEDNTVGLTFTVRVADLKSNCRLEIVTTKERSYSHTYTDKEYKVVCS